MMKKAELIAAIDCCATENCEECPMMDSFCDDPRTPFTSVPVLLLEAVRDELIGTERRAERVQ